jgi:hypothetical protein
MGDRHRRLAAIGADVYVIATIRRGARGRAGNNLALGHVGLIHLLFLEKNRPGSRNGCICALE